MATRAELVALLRKCRIEAGTNFPLNLRARIDAALAEPEAGKTVRVRVAVYVNDEGSWSVNGNLLTHRPVANYVITADVPLPQAVEVEGEVNDG